MKQEFLDFLKSNRDTITINYNAKSKIIINKVKYNDKLDILYALNSYSGNPFDLKSSFKYSGIYDKDNDKLLDVEYGIRFDVLNWDYNSDEYISSDDLYKLISSDVNEKIKELVEDGKDDIFDIINVELAEELEDRDVIALFVNGETSEGLQDSYREFSTEKAQDLLDYLSNKDSFLEEEARDFIMENTTSILKDLALTEEKRKILKKIEDNKEHPYHKIKNIIDAVKDNHCVTVNLTINKDDKEQTFKYNANTLLNSYDSSYLSSSYIEKLADRNLFEDTFGRWGTLHYKDITKITYGKNTIYEDTNFKVKEEEFCLT